MFSIEPRPAIPPGHVTPAPDLYFHLPNFVLAALMYTLLGRALLGLNRGAGFVELHLALRRSFRRDRRDHRDERVSDAAATSTI
jgi:hypothetical protein